MFIRLEHRQLDQTTNASARGCLDDAPLPFGLPSALRGDQKHAIDIAQRRHNRVGPIHVAHHLLDLWPESLSLRRIAYEGSRPLTRSNKLLDDLATDGARRPR